MEVENGRPFCPKCRAPQVRVEFASLPPVAVASATDLGIAPDHLNAADLRSSADPAFVRTALQAGLLGVMANLIPFGLGMVLTGILAALLYHRASGMLRFGKALRLGAVAGAIAFAATALLTVLAVVLLHAQQQFHDFMMTAFEQSVARQSGPDVQKVLQLIHTPQGFGIVLAIFMLGFLLLSMLLSAAGSVIGSALFRDHKQPPL